VRIVKKPQKIPTISIGLVDVIFKKMFEILIQLLMSSADEMNKKQTPEQFSVRFIFASLLKLIKYHLIKQVFFIKRNFTGVLCLG